ncbi:hypothetical protein [Pseudomonas proteolytica]|uniref:hypothetical protein n=1 Tax=Pseudomonas proteolytica TaxID=219574 RepID=UPI0030EF162D
MAISLADLMTPYIEPMFDKLFGVDRAKSEVYSGSVIRSQEDIDYLNHRDRSASDSLPPGGSTAAEERQASADALAGALSRAPIKVENQQSFTLQIDGQALETKITQVNERQNYETLGDLKTTTER